MEGLIGKINVCTLNVRGLRNAKKRYNIFQKLKNKKHDIIALQETHLTEKDKNIIYDE